MDKKLSDQDVLLVKEKDSNEMKVVTGQNKDGTPKTASPQEANNPDFLKIDKNGNVLENFFANFMRQAKDPTQFEFFKMPALIVEQGGAKDLQAAAENPEKPENKATLDMHRVEPETFKQAQAQPQSQPQTQTMKPAIDESRVDWKQFERLGITREALEKTGNLDAILNWRKSSLLPITAKVDDMSIRTDARLSFRKMPDDTLCVSIHAIRKEPELNRPYFGIKFTDEDKQNLLETGNLGRVANAEYKQGEPTPVFISIDKQTNELVAVRADLIRVSDTIKGVQLDEKQKQALSEGKEVYIEGMTSKKDTPFSAYLQVNADRRGLAFRFDNDKKQDQSQQSGQSQSKDTPQNAEKQAEKQEPKKVKKSTGVKM